jgi:hypothetical protein
VTRKKTTVYVEADLLRSARIAAARSGKRGSDIFEGALRSYLGRDVLERVWQHAGEG